MYICPICGREFSSEDSVAKHLNRCWKEEHPYHQAKSAPQSADIETREVNDEVLNFFSSLQKR